MLSIESIGQITTQTLFEYTWCLKTRKLATFIAQQLVQSHHTRWRLTIRMIYMKKPTENSRYFYIQTHIYVNHYDARDST